MKSVSQQIRSGKFLPEMHKKWEKVVESGEKVSIFV